MVTKRKRKMVSKHYQRQRSEREKFIDECLGGDGKIIDSFIVDKGHKNGLERHNITDNGIIIIYNLSSKKLVSKLIARPCQIKRYYQCTGKRYPKGYKKILALAERHKILGYNEL